VSAAARTVDYLNVGLYSILAIAALVQWHRGRGRPALWAALAFGAIGCVVLASHLPARAESGLIIRFELALLVLFPFLLYKFTTAFEKAERGLERFVGLMTLVLVVWSFALRDVPREGEAWSNAFIVYIVAFLFHWTLLSIIAAVRLWRAGRAQPRVAQRRMRFLAAACAILTAAILLAALSQGDESALALTADVLATFGAIGFLVGVAPPLVLRLLWRRPDVARTQHAIAGLMRAETPEDVTAGVLPGMLGIVGARAVELRDAHGRIVGSYGTHEDGDDVEALDLKLPEGSLSVWTSRHAPFFGDEEIATLRTLGALTELALDRARLFSQEQAARRTLEEADELKQNFIALAAHELRTPVAVIHGVIETIERRGDALADDQLTDLEEMLRTQAANLKLLVEQLLDLSRLEARAVPIQPSRIPVRERLDKLVALTAGARAAEVELKVPEGLEAVVDPNAFDRIVSNLVTNALRYGRAPIRISAERENGRLQVAVEDRGDGVPSEFIPRLFERFSRSDPSRRRAGGTGLGLAIAHSYAEAHAGELRYRHATPHGARFELVLPTSL
jgi:signal transduction histidine kinase